MVKDRPLRDFIGAMDRRKPFTLSRWGLQEWSILFGHRDALPDPEGHIYYSSLRNELNAVLLARPTYRLALSLPRDAGEAYSRARNYIHGAELTNLDWCKNPFRMSTPAHVQAFIGAINRVNFILVGPAHLRRLKTLIHYSAVVDVPPRNAYLCKDDIIRNTLAELEDTYRPAVVGVSAGVTAPLIVHELFLRAGSRHTIVDFGSVWEPFAGRKFNA